MNVEIITIGDEILIGQIVDTNSAWMAPRLNDAGMQVIRITSVKDDSRQIMQAFDAAFSHVDVVLVTGGLGPTKDDITKKTLCDYFHTKSVFSQAVYDNVVAVISDRMPQINRLTETQAWVPEACTVIQNRLGTAPVMWFEKEGKILVSMPGVPHEMKGAMEHDIIPRLVERNGGKSVIEHRTFMVRNYLESTLAEKLEMWETQLPTFIKLAYLPQWGIIRLRLTGIHESREVLKQALDKEEAALKSILNKGELFASSDSAIEEVIGEKLKQSGLTLSTAESCTGGSIAQRITSVSGASAYYKGSVVAYSNEVKQSMLGVPQELLEQYGAVSEQVVQAMARGVKKALQTDCSVATSGIAGPGGGTKEKPVGTICIAVCVKEKEVVKTLHLRGVRETNVTRTVNTVLLQLLEMLS